MARLTEPPALCIAPASALTATPPSGSYIAGADAESNDALKRRLVRQNRELAKSNSTQALRIRSLDLEAGRLLAENLELRERVLRLVSVELPRARRLGVERIGEALKRKLGELRELAEEGLAFTETEEGEERAQEKGVSEVLAGMAGQWRERQPLTDAMRETMLPTISEDKGYPRLSQPSTDSPDLGPPPIAHLDGVADDALRQVSPSIAKSSSAINTVISPTALDITDKDEVLPATLSINLETRRKRKDGQPKLEIRRHSIMPPCSPPPLNATTELPSPSMLKTGAKRKLSDRDLEVIVPPPAKSDFAFSRRQIKAGRQTADSQPTTTSAKSVPPPAVSPVVTPVVRRVLGEKSVNLSPRKVSSSPKKTEKTERVDDDYFSKSIAAQKPSQTRPGRTSATRPRTSSSAIPLPSPPAPPTHQVHPTIELPSSASRSFSAPQPSKSEHPTPLQDQLFQSPDSFDSILRQSTRSDTPSDLSMLSTTSTLDSRASGSSEAASRPSRRSRAPVNYAEPSLVAKMRRPGKKLEDAVTGLRDVREVMTSGEGRRADVRVEIELGSDGERRKGGVKVKTEPVEDDAETWRKRPVPAGQEGRGASPQGGGDGVLSSSTTIVALLSTTSTSGRTSKRRDASISLGPLPEASRSSTTDQRTTPQSLPDPDIDAATRRLRDMELFDFAPSSSPATDAATGSAASGSTTTSTSASAGLRRGRRHSAAVAKGWEGLGAGAGATMASRGAGVEEGRAVRVGNGDDENKAVKGEGVRREEGRAEETAVGRGRRRSMMV